ncbi:MAG: hypothetical protein WC337_10090 [Candidatus Muiribacteriota bacterium]|jgi:hypothetical protein
MEIKIFNNPIKINEINNLNDIIHDLYFWENDIKLYKTCLIFRCKLEDRFVENPEKIKKNFFITIRKYPIYRVWVIIKNIKRISKNKVDEFNCINYLSVKDNKIVLDVGKKIEIEISEFEIVVIKKKILFYKEFKSLF